jgi:hypothetical protein
MRGDGRRRNRSVNGGGEAVGVAKRWQSHGRQNSCGSRGLDIVDAVWAPMFGQ